ncbi:hypothetical protein [Streptomyces cinereoruber]|uniref:hypothetical protein n=1 Tax=Streptomyces cinereoruber TaxID=67260 RepID=UPI003631E500
MVVIRGRNRGRGTRAGAAADRAPATGGIPPVTAPASRWLFTGGDGRLTAYATSAAGPVRWTETANGTFDGPYVIETPGWAGPLSLASSREGYVYFAGLCVPEDGGLPGVVVSTQYQTGRPLADWYDLGVPVPAGEEDAASDTIVAGPVVVVNQGSGSVHVLVSLLRTGILRRSRTGEGRWGRWKRVTDRAYTGEFAAAMPTGGPLEVLAVGHEGAVDRWAGAGGGRFELRDRFGMAVADSTGTVLETGRKRVTYVWRHPGDDSVVAWRAQGGEPGRMLPLGGAGGRGRPGVTRAPIGGYDCTVLAQAGAHGTVEVSAYVTENEDYGIWWAPVGDPATPLFSPQPGVDGAGRVVVAALDGTGALVLTRQNPAQDGLAFGPWNREGTHARSASGRQW